MVPCPSATGGSGRDTSISQPSTVGMNPENPQTASGRRPEPSPSASDITQPCENPPSTSFSCGSASSHSETMPYDDQNVSGSGKPTRGTTYQCAPPGGSDSGPRGVKPS